MDLFENKSIFQPLAEKLRPKSLEEFIGQENILSQGKPLRKMIENGTISSVIFWGPPGTGKTTLARLIAKYSKTYFEELSAVTSGVTEVRKTISESRDRIKFYKKKTIIFIDEIHRFNKAQQDAFLPAVEDGTITLIGATTENPSFEVNAPLISRSTVYVFDALTDKEIEKIIHNAVKFFPKHKFDKKALAHIIKTANGDARTAINSLELATVSSKNINLKIAEEAVQKKAIYYDKKGDWHYDIISAFIKSMRASEPDAALYWLARMIKAGEDPMFIARRMVIFASEDISNLQPTALVVATSTMQAVHMVGMPEAQIILAQCATYLATSPKSTASYMGLMMAIADVENEKLEPVPLHLRNAPTKLMKNLGYGKGHVRYPYEHPEKAKLEYLPNNLKGRKYYSDPRKNIKN